jgi:hypothetical protein
MPAGVDVSASVKSDDNPSTVTVSGDSMGFPTSPVSGSLQPTNPKTTSNENTDNLLVRISVFGSDEKSY